MNVSLMERLLELRLHEEKYRDKLFELLDQSKNQIKELDDMLKTECKRIGLHNNKLSGNCDHCFQEYETLMERADAAVAKLKSDRAHESEV